MREKMSARSRSSAAVTDMLGDVSEMASERWRQLRIDKTELYATFRTK